MQLVHLASRLYGTPLLIARPKLDVILSVLGSCIGLPDLDMAMPLPTQRQSATSGQAGIAVIPVVGTLVRRSMGIEAASGLMSYGEIETAWTPRWPTHRWRASCSIWTRPAARPRVC